LRAASLPRPKRTGPENNYGRPRATRRPINRRAPTGNQPDEPAQRRFSTIRTRHRRLERRAEIYQRLEYGPTSASRPTDLPRAHHRPATAGKFGQCDVLRIALRPKKRTSDATNILRENRRRRDLRAFDLPISWVRLRPAGQRRRSLQSAWLIDSLEDMET